MKLHRASSRVSPLVSPFGSSLALSLVIATSASGGFFVGPDWKEGTSGTGDAGAFPSNAQVPVTALPFPAQLRTIAGDLESFGAVGGADQQDVYAIFITSPFIFQATTDSSVDSFGFTSFNSQLFLFDSSGLPVVGNDGFGMGATVTLPTFSLVPGVYYLAISLFNSDPLDSGASPLFPDLTGPQLLPSSVATPAGWTFSSADGGSYTIALTGAAFVPAPSAVLLLALTALGGRRRGSVPTRGEC